MPRVIDDEMVELPEDVKALMKRIGHKQCARIICKTDSYVRYLTSKGEKRIRKMDLVAIETYNYKGG